MDASSDTLIRRSDTGHKPGPWGQAVVALVVVVVLVVSVVLVVAAVLMVVGLPPN